MAESKAETSSIRLSTEAVEAAKIAAAYKGLSVLEYASAILLAAANHDIEEGHRSRGQKGSPSKRQKSE